MNRRINKFTNMLAVLTIFAMCIQFFTFSAFAQIQNLRVKSDDRKAVENEFSTVNDLPDERKLSPDMEKSVGSLEDGLRQDGNQRVIITLKEELN